jgi:hypothetical protein
VLGEDCSQKIFWDKREDKKKYVGFRGEDHRTLPNLQLFELYWKRKIAPRKTAGTGSRPEEHWSFATTMM